MRKILTRIAATTTAAAAVLAVPGAAHADVIGGDVNVDVFAPVTVLVHDVLNGLLVNIL